MTSFEGLQFWFLKSEWKNGNIKKRWFLKVNFWMKYYEIIKAPTLKVPYLKRSNRIEVFYLNQMSSFEGLQFWFLKNEWKKEYEKKNRNKLNFFEANMPSSLGDCRF